MQEINVSKLPSSKHFSLLQVKQLLPFHQEKVIDNLNIMFNNYALSNYPKNIILLPDDRLSLKHVSTAFCYTNSKAVWSQDIDGQVEHLRNSLSLASSLLNYIGSIDEDSPVDENEKEAHDYIKKSSVLLIDNGQKIQQRKGRYSEIKQTKTLISFKIQKINNRIYTLLGINIKSRQIPALACSTLRNWNMGRHKIQCLPFKIDLIHKMSEHIFCMGRGFIRQVSDDYNSYSPNIAEMLSQIKVQDDSSKIIQAFKLAKLSSNHIGNIPQNMVILNWEVILRKGGQQNSIWEILGQMATQWLLQTPINMSCSYNSSIQYDENTNTIKVILASHFAASKHKFPQDNNFSKIIADTQMLLFDHTFKKPEPQMNSLRNSIALLKKYEGSTDRFDKDNLIFARQLTPSDSNNSLNDSFMSQMSNDSKRPNMKNIAKLENQIYQILKMLDSKKLILSPKQIQDLIRLHVKKLQKQNRESNFINDAQFEVLDILDAINILLTAEEFYSLIRNNINDSNLLSTYLMQKDKYYRAVVVGRMIAADHLESLYKKCLKQGLVVQKNTIIPSYLKKMVQAYVDPPLSIKQLKVQQISVPALVQIFQKKNYDSHFYSSVLNIVIPQLFTNFNPIIKILAPLLFHFIEQLLRMNHHQELVFSFIGDLLFEICYFTTETKLNSLTNAVYMEEKHTKILTIKEKKIIEMLREGGFKGFGFEIKTHIYQTIQTNKTYQIPEELLYHSLQVQKPLELYHFYKLLSSCHYTPSIDRVAKFLESKNSFAQVLNRSSPMVCFLLPKNRQNNFDFRMSQNKVQQSQFNSIAERILRSESGIFQDIVKLNPKVKIAGIQLQSAIRNLSQSRFEKAGTKSKGSVDQEEAVSYYLDDKRNNFEYVTLALSLKQKYLRYPTLSQNQKSYFRDCATSVIDHKQEIFEYISLSSKMKNQDKLK